MMRTLMVLLNYKVINDRRREMMGVMGGINGNSGERTYNTIN
jgi:hypothetical protein